MRVRTFGPSILGCLAWACGGSAEPPVTAPAPAASASASAETGAATAADPYASFDAGAGEATDAPHPTPGPGPSADLGAVCQKAAAAWEKRARPELKACYRQGKKAEPNLMGTARISVEVAYDGKPKPAKLDEPSSLGDEVAKCMVDAVSKTPFPEATECKSRTLTIPVEFPSKPK